MQCCLKQETTGDQSDDASKAAEHRPARHHFEHSPRGKCSREDAARNRLPKLLLPPQYPSFSQRPLSWVGDNHRFPAEKCLHKPGTLLLGQHRLTAEGRESALHLLGAGQVAVLSGSDGREELEIVQEPDLPAAIGRHRRGLATVPVPGCALLRDARRRRLAQDSHIELGVLERGEHQVVNLNLLRLHGLARLVLARTLASRPRLVGGRGPERRGRDGRRLRGLQRLLGPLDDELLIDHQRRHGDLAAVGAGALLVHSVLLLRARRAGRDDGPARPPWARGARGPADGVPL
mmetsp:Transcript_61285/g.150809  ORF Transcript_61285/g.150809 Transcript_61285/m.150809 type:complete len:291 (-) Transcript_61285:634-1506(-)